MRPQAPASPNSSVHPPRKGLFSGVRTPGARRPAASAGPYIVPVLAALLAGVSGCGSGFVATATQSQPTIAVPTASAQGPQLGYLWLSADQTLRPILGVAGASQMGKSMVPAGAYVGAASSASANVAVLQDSEGAFDVMTLPAGPAASLNVTLPPGANLRLSPSGSAALFYSPGATSAILVTGLQTTPQSQSLKIAGPIAGAAVSDTGTAALEYSTGSSLTLAVTPAGGHSVSLASLGSNGGLTFLAGQDDLLYADGSSNAVTLVRSSTSAASSTQLQTAGLVKSPLAVGVSDSGRWVIVVNSGSQSVVRIDLTTQASTSVACSCKPTEVAVLADDGAFRLTNASSGPNWIVDASSPTLRTLFIPALPAQAKTSLSASAVAP